MPENISKLWAGFYCSIFYVSFVWDLILVMTGFCSEGMLVSKRFKSRCKVKLEFPILVKTGKLSWCSEFRSKFRT